MSGSRPGGSNKNVEGNEHIPSYIKNRPWYLKSDHERKWNENENDYLSHHRNKKHDHTQQTKEIIDSFVPIRAIAEKVDDNGCSNCGCSGHIKRDCLEAPRKRIRSQVVDTTSEQSRETGLPKTMLTRDSKLLDSNYDAKRDRWYGYTPEINKKPLDNTNIQDEQLPEMDLIQMQEIERLGLTPEDVGFKAASKKTEAIRRRDDVAPYLQDITEEESLYDPKSRVYKTKLHGEIDPKTKMFHRHLTGEALKVKVLGENVRKTAKEQGVDDLAEDEHKPSYVLAANPTKFELMMRDKESAENASNGKDKNTDSQTSSTKDLKTFGKQLAGNKSSKIKHLYDMYM